jgi:hypothetical protein
VGIGRDGRHGQLKKSERRSFLLMLSSVEGWFCSFSK